MLGPLLTLILVGLFGVAGLLCLSSLRTARGAERLVPKVGRLVPVPGGAIHVAESGKTDAPPVVLVHGLAGQLQHFTYAMTELLEPEYRVIAVDRPGCGYSTREGDDLAAPDAQARMIWAALDALGVSRPVLVGHSLGGMMVLAMAIERPGAAAGLVLLAPWTHPNPTPAPFFDGLRVRSPLLRRLLGYTLAVPMAQRQAQETLDLVFAPESWPEDFPVRGGGALGLRPKGYVTASGDLVAGEDAVASLAARYGGIGEPGEVLLGAADALLPPDEQGGPMSAHGFAVKTLPGRGHMLPLLAPQECVAAVGRVAARCSGSGESPPTEPAP